jgi:hypothetical protein
VYGWSSLNYFVTNYHKEEVSVRVTWIFCIWRHHCHRLGACVTAQHYFSEIFVWLLSHLSKKNFGALFKNDTLLTFVLRKIAQIWKFRNIKLRKARESESVSTWGRWLQISNSIHFWFWIFRKRKVWWIRFHHGLEKRMFSVYQCVGCGVRRHTSMSLVVHCNLCSSALLHCFLETLVCTYAFESMLQHRTFPCVVWASSMWAENVCSSESFYTVPSCWLCRCVGSSRLFTVFYLVFSIDTEWRRKALGTRQLTSKAMCME